MEGSICTMYIIVLTEVLDIEGSRCIVYGLKKAFAESRLTIYGLPRNRRVHSAKRSCLKKVDSLSTDYPHMGPNNYISYADCPQ